MAMALGLNNEEKCLLKVLDEKWHIVRINESVYATAKDELVEVRNIAEWAQNNIGAMLGHQQAPWFDPDEGWWFGIRLSRQFQLDLNCKYVLAFKNPDDFLMFKLQWPHLNS
jgi:hypothetical protein